MPKTILETAANILSRREHTRTELAEKLRARGCEEEDITRALDRLTETDLLSDKRFALSYIRQKQKQFGDWRLRMELMQRGISEAEADAALQQVPRAAEEKRAAVLLAEKYPDGVAAEKTAQAQRFLQQRGFSAGATRTAMEKKK